MTNITREDIAAIPQPVYEAFNAAYLNLDSCMPLIDELLDHLGNTDAARTYFLVQRALTEAHGIMTSALGGTKRS